MVEVIYVNGKTHLFIDGLDTGEFFGIPQRDLEVGDQFQEFDMETGGFLTRQIISKEYQNGMLFVRSVVVNG